jgi:hypothetical protein
VHRADVGDRLPRDEFHPTHRAGARLGRRDLRVHGTPAEVVGAVGRAVLESGVSQVVEQDVDDSLRVVASWRLEPSRHDDELLMWRFASACPCGPEFVEIDSVEDWIDSACGGMLVKGTLRQPGRPRRAARRSCTRERRETWTG